MVLQEKEKEYRGLISFASKCTMGDLIVSLLIPEN